MSQVNLSGLTQGTCEQCLLNSQQTGSFILTLECQHTFCLPCIKSTQKHKYFIQCLKCKIIDFQDISQIDQILPEQPIQQNFSQNISASSSKTQVQAICSIHNQQQEIMCIQDLTMICKECSQSHTTEGHELIEENELIKQFINNQTQENRQKVKQAEVKAIDLLNNYYSQLETLNTKQTEVLDKVNSDTQSLMQALQAISKRKVDEINHQFANQREEFEQKVFILEQVVKRCDKNTESCINNEFAKENSQKMIEEFQNRLKQIEFMRSCYQNKELNEFVQENLSFTFNQNTNQIKELIENFGTLKIEKTNQICQKQLEKSEKIQEFIDPQEQQKSKSSNQLQDVQISQKDSQEKIDQITSRKSNNFDEENTFRKSPTQTISFGNSLPSPSQSFANSVKSSLVIAEREDLEQLKGSFQSLDQEYIDNFIQYRILQDEQKQKEKAQYMAVSSDSQYQYM